MRVPAYQAHTFVCATARWFGFESRVTLNNKTGVDYWVMASLHTEDGQLIGRSRNLGTLADDGMFFADISDVERKISGSISRQELVVTFSMVPGGAVAWDQEIEIDPKELYRQCTAQDHYVEHYDEATGYSSGVLFQAVPMNSRLLPSTYSFLLQAPKVFLSAQRNTAFLLEYYCADGSGVTPKVASVHCKLKNEQGETFLLWEEKVHRQGFRYVNVRETLLAHGLDYRDLVSKHGFCHFEAFCADASFIALTCNFNEKLRTFDIEHSLPPPYYQFANSVEERRRTVEYYAKNFCEGGAGSLGANERGNTNLFNGGYGEEDNMIGNSRTEVDVPNVLKAREEAFFLLSQLIMTQECRVEQFDFSYLDVLPQMLTEMYGFDPTGDSPQPHAKWLLSSLKRVVGLSGDSDIGMLVRSLKSIGIRDEHFRGRWAPFHVKSKNRYDSVENWHDFEGVTQGDSVEKVNRLQALYSLQSGGSQECTFTDLSRPETGDVWTNRIQKWIATKLVDASRPALTIGPRWSGEITYFRNVVGLKAAIGLDLFSRNPDLVQVGDMHNMSFEDNKFGLVYQRNTFNKSYDIRKALDECWRVLKPGGVLISDDCLSYTDGVSEIARTNVSRLNWFLQYLGDRVDDVLFFKETPSQESWFGICGQIALTIKK